MANHFGSKYENHPMIAPVYERIAGIETQLNHLELAVNTILKHLDISLPGAGPNAAENDQPAGQTEDASNLQVLEEAYQYMPLDTAKAEIRLLALQNADDDASDLRGSLANFSLEAKQAPGTKQYSALSYCWGTPNMSQRILIDGHVFRITESLESALKQMRKHATKAAASTRASSSTSFWWIDQICINQADIEERGYQVSLMRRIYKSANIVQVWLGESVDGTALAMDLVRKIGRPPRRGPGEKEVNYPELSLDEVRQNWQSLCLLSSIPWWGRAWIRQEVSLGSRAVVHWGEHSVDFEALSQAVMAMEYADSIGHATMGFLSVEQAGNPTAIDDSFYRHAGNLRAFRKKSHTGRSFLPFPELLLRSRNCQATDLRDRVYSVAGLADSEVYRLKVDYHSSVSDVLKSAAQAIMPQKHGLRLLGTCQNAERRHNLPSWTPNLIDEWKYQPFEPAEVFHNISIADSSVEFDGDVLVTKGHIFDAVGSICGSQVPGNATTKQLDDVYTMWHDFAVEALDAGELDFRGAMHSIRDKKDLFWVNFLSTDRKASMFVRYSADDNKTLLSEREEALKMQYPGLNLQLARSYLLPASDESATLHPLRRIRDALKKYGSGRKLGLCRTKRTLVFLPGDALPNDVIVVLRGATFPYVLRAVPGDNQANEQYVLVGEAFLPEHATISAMGISNREPSVVIRIV